MVFSSLYESAGRGELILLDGGMCRFHLRRDKQVTIHEIIVDPARQRTGIGRTLLAELRRRAPDASIIVAKCPAGYEANSWYSHVGFVCDREEKTPGGTVLNVWVLPCT